MKLTAQNTAQNTERNTEQNRLDTAQPTLPVAKSALTKHVAARVAVRAFVLGLLSLTSLHGAFAEPQSVNVNDADAATIAEVLDGVGLSRAQAIVEYRDQNGAFVDIYDLANVKGIGDRTIELNAERIRVTD